MVEHITDFGAFIKQVADNNKYEITFHADGREFAVHYSDLNTDQDVKLMKEFEAWFAAMYKSDKKDIALVAILEQQYRIWKMIKPHVAGLTTFDDFMKLPPAFVMAMILAVNEDMKRRYPHLAVQKQMV